ncbi:HNH endonuclease signature motif containing protein [Acetobacter sicerae]
MAPRLKCIALGPKAMDPRIASAPPKRADPFYLTKPWRVLMERLIETRGRVCQKCGRVDVRLFGDHIRELKDGGAPLDPANIQLLCGSCHTIKTARARAARMASSSHRGNG